MDANTTETTAILLIAHGSRHQAANADLFQLAEQIEARGDYAIVEPSFLELAEPDIAEGGERCVRRGASRVLLIPYFLSAGVHLLRDLTAARDLLKSKHPDVDFRLGSALGPHRLLEALVVEKIRSLDAGEEVDAQIKTTSPAFAKRFAPIGEADDHP